jgi:hypothetical protein
MLLLNCIVTWYSQTFLKIKRKLEKNKIKSETKYHIMNLKLHVTF